MKKFAVLLLALSLVCGVLTGCASDKGNIDDTDGVVTDSPRDDDSIIDDDMGDGKIGDKDKDKNNNNDNNSSTNSGNNNSSGSTGNTGSSASNSGNSGGNNDAPVPTSIPGNSTTATQPVTP